VRDWDGLWGRVQGSAGAKTCCPTKPCLHEHRVKDSPAAHARDEELPILYPFGGVIYVD
jgi:hypothetical protein